MSYIEKEKLIKADIASIENRVRHAFNQGYDLGFKDGKKRTKPLEQDPSGDNVVSRDVVKEKMIMYGFHAPDMTVTEFVEDLPPVNPKEPTTKNDLGVDCIKKSDAIYIIQDMHGLARADVILDAVNRIITMPSVTPQEPRWIPVSERLPKIADVYLVTRYYVLNPSYVIDACFFDGSNTWYNDNRINHKRHYVDNVIAWQENPEPYKVKSYESKVDNEKEI